MLNVESPFQPFIFHLSPFHLFMTYEQTLEFLYTRHTSVYRGLTRIRYVLEKLGNPQNTFPSVLITGTNGKGSTAKMISTILTEAGYRVGCFTSPHLIDFEERITINEETIPRSDVIELAEEIRRGPLGSLECNHEALHIEGIVSFFEIVTGMGFLYFARQRVDIAILEVGIGGRLDATNTVNPLISVITNIGLDHQQFLGDTIREIAREKAAIIRRQGDIVTGCQKPEAIALIEAVCREKNATLYKTGILDSDPECKPQFASCDPKLRFAAHTIPHKISSTGSFFSYQGLFSHLDDVYIRLAGVHQLANAAVALCTLELLNKKGFYTDERAIRAGLSNVVHPGRLEVIHAGPMFVVDIAHNFMGAATIAQALTSIFDYDKLIIIIGVLQDKDVRGILRPFLAVADSIIFTSPHNTDRAEAAVETAQIAEDIVRTSLHTTLDNASPLARYDHWIVCDSVEAAIRQGHRIAGKRDLICVTGSNYTVSEVEVIYRKHILDTL
jgi:dihydrofolate synthase/folylpolyglutamate synthase